MTRQEFIKMFGILGISIPLQFSVSSCGDENVNPFKGKVLVIGAGAGGLSAGYYLKQQNTEFEILEASTSYGGRMKINKSFADFPIPLGSEWLETSTSIFKTIVNDDSVNVNIQTIADDPDRKFVNYSWFNFFEDYIVPSVASQIKYSTVVQSIDYSADQVVVTTSNGTFTADKVIVAVPLKILQVNDIAFTPSLPQVKLNAIYNIPVWEGFKAFFEFSTKFYDDEYDFQISPETDGQKIYYNAALGQNTSKKILGLFVVGKPAQDFISRTGNDLRNFILNELDSLYGGKATPNYIKHITQNWNNEPYIKGGYVSDYADWKKVKELRNAVNGKIYFAGSEYTDGEDWVSVNNAAISAKYAISEINK